jgi:hypothetical protein
LARRRRAAGEEDLPAPDYLGEVQDRRLTQWLAAIARDRAALRERRASLDQRVQRGEIDQYTRRIYLAAARRQASRLRGDSPLSRPVRWLRRIFREVVLPLVALAMLIAGGVDIGPWKEDIFLLVLGTLIMARWLWLVPGRRLRRRRWAAGAGRHRGEPG